MGEVEKLFDCPQPGCGMSFPSEITFEVHRRSHDIQLSIFGGDTLTTPFKDETPTPIRLMKYCDDLYLNPFDEQFRKASQSQRFTIPDVSISLPEDDTLDTPRVIVPVDSDETISSTSKDDAHITVSSSNLSSCYCGDLPNQPQKHIVSSMKSESFSENNEPSVKSLLKLNVTSASEVSHTSSSGSIISTPTPVIMAGPSVTHSLNSNAQENKEKLPFPNIHTKSVSCLTQFNESLQKVSESPATVLQLVLRLPNGQAIPVEIPATPVSSAATSVIMASSSMCEASVSANPSLTKMKLKQVLSSNNSAAKVGCSTKTSKANTADRIAELTRKKTDSFFGPLVDCQDVCSFTNGRKEENRKRSFSTDDDPEEKRRKFLERNRAAAVRCREKKKQWVKYLADKSDELTKINQKLQCEVASLRSEVATLKAMLLHHKDCPVTLAMQDSNVVQNREATSATLFCNQPILYQHKPRTRSQSLPSVLTSTVPSLISFVSLPQCQLKRSSADVKVIEKPNYES